MQKNECTNEERWCTCPYPAIRYEVSTLGRIRYKRTGNLIKLGYTKYKPKTAMKFHQSSEKRYAYFSMKYKRKQMSIPVHRCVAIAFIQRPSDDLFTRYEVDHKNGIKSDNRVENLEWVTHSENMRRWHEKRRQRNG